MCVTRDGRACSNDEFREAVERQEGEDARRLQERMQRSLDATEGSHCGVSQLRTFLEAVLRQRYLDSVPQMLPLLEKEFRKVVRLWELQLCLRACWYQTHALTARTNSCFKGRKQVPPDLQDGTDLKLLMSHHKAVPDGQSKVREFAVPK